jgi:catechol-2,3-dioxygenase
LAEFYRQLLGSHYRKGGRATDRRDPRDADGLVLLDDNGSGVVTIQQKQDATAPTWPSEDVPMQIHTDFKVPTVEDLERHRERAEKLGARLLYDLSRGEGEPLYVVADPAGHPFCLRV